MRISTPDGELPFAGHPAPGTCHARLEAGGRPADPDRIPQACGTGLVEIRPDGDGPAFAAPPLLRSGPVDEEALLGIPASLRITRPAIGRAGRVTVTCDAEGTIRVGGRSTTVIRGGVER